MPESARICHNRAAHILVVDDEAHIRLPLVKALCALGYNVDQAGSGREALDLLQHTAYDLIVLDLHMPDVGGIDVMHYAHLNHPNMLIVVLTGYATVENAIAAIKSNAADYVRKPAKLNHIVSIVEHLLVKHQQRIQREKMIDTLTQAVESLRGLEDYRPTALDTSPPIEDSFVAIHPLTLDWQQRQITVDGQPPEVIELTDSESAVLHRLMAQPGRTFSCRELAHAALGYDTDEIDAENVIRPCIFRLRRKLATHVKTSQLVCTVRGRGYRFNFPATSDERQHFAAPAPLPNEPHQAVA